MPRTIAELSRSPGTVLGDNTIDVVIQPDWTVDDEQQLSYTSLVCLAECLREFHWQRDLGTLAGTDEFNAISRSMSAEFLRPVLIGDRVTLSYALSELGPTSYRFICRVAGDDRVCAVVEVELVFTRPGLRGRAPAPDHVRRKLAAVGTEAERQPAGPG